MIARAALLFLTALAMTPGLCLAQSTSPNGVRTLHPPGAIKAERTWSLGVRAGDFVFVAGTQRPTPWSRIRRRESYAPSSISS
jgi:2-iminobutanoate/2-iminopropanoate deaminase